MKNKLSVSRKRKIKENAPLKNMNLKVPKASLKHLHGIGKTIRPLNVISKLNVPKKRQHISKKIKHMKPMNIKHQLKNPSLNVAYNVNSIRRMNWKQLKKRYPNMNPTSDADFDGLINSRDCKPLDPSKDGMFSKFIGKILKGKDKDELYEKAEAKEKATKKYFSEVSAQELVEQARTKDVEAGGVEPKGKTATQILSEVAKEERVTKKEYEKGESRFQKFSQKVKEAKIAREKLQEEQGLAKKRLMTERIERVKSKVKEIGEQLEPEKTLVGRLVKKIPTKTSKEARAIKARRTRGIVKAVERFAGVRGSVTRVAKVAKGQKLAGAGRPKGSYKYKDPRTGQPVSAVEYHKLRKQLKSQAKTVETRTEIQQRIALAKRGLSPEEVAAAQEEMNARMARLRAIKEMKQEGVTKGVTEGVTEDEVATQEIEMPVDEQKVIEQQVRQIPTQVIRRSQPQPPQRIGTAGVPPGYRLQEDLMTGRKTLVAIPQRESWTR